MRPLSTSSRMYLETDIPLFKIEEDSIENIKNNLPELPDVKKERIIKEYSLSDDLANQLVRRLRADDFEYIVSKIEGSNIDSTTIASVLAYDLREIKREGYNISNVNNESLISIFNLLADSKISKDAVNKIIIAISENPTLDPEEIAKNNNLLVLDENEVLSIIEDIVAQNSSMVEERKMGAMGPLMGMAMGKLKGKADGKLVNKLLKNEIEKLI